MLKDSLCLVIDTSTTGCIAGFFDLGTGQYLAQFVENQKQATDQSLYQLCADFCQKNSFPLRQLGKVAIATGPGSFTGIKIGMAFVYGLKAANPELEVFDFSSLQLCAQYLAGVKGRPVQVAMSSTRSHGFVFSSQPTMPSGLFPVSEYPQWLDSTSEIYLLDGFCQLTDRLTSDARAFECLDPNGVATTILAAIRERLTASPSVPWLKSSPAPNFMRQPTVVEKQIAASPAT